MNQALQNRIEHAIAEQLKTALDDIITGVMEDQLECFDFDTQYDAHQDAIENFEADINELAENCTEAIQGRMQLRIMELSKTLGERWDHDCLGAIQDFYETNGKVDGPARRESWCNFIDSLQKDGELTQYEANYIDFDVESL